MTNAEQTQTQPPTSQQIILAKTQESEKSPANIQPIIATPINQLGNTTTQTTDLITPAQAPHPQITSPMQAITTDTDTLAQVPYFQNPAHHVIEPVTIEHNGDTVMVQQLRVGNQFEQDNLGNNIGGGDSSCGYHAGLKNAAAITALIQGNDDAHVQAMITDNSIAHQMFNQDPRHLGQLRQIIIKHREKIALRRLYANSLMSITPEKIYPEEPIEVIQGLYNTLLKEYLDNAIDKLFHDRNSCHTNELTEQDIINTLSNMPISLSDKTINDIGSTREELTLYLHNQETIRRFVQLKIPLLRISPDDIPTAWEAYNEDSHNRGLPLLEPNGDWLNGEEIERLITIARKDSEFHRNAFEPNRVSVHVLDSTQSEMLDITDVAQLREAIRTKSGLESRIHVFIINSLFQSQGQQHSPSPKGHWNLTILETVCLSILAENVP